MPAQVLRLAAARAPLADRRKQSKLVARSHEPPPAPRNGPAVPQSSAKTHIRMADGRVSCCQQLVPSRLPSPFSAAMNVVAAAWATSPPRT